MEDLFSFEDMHATSALSSSASEKASFGYISKLSIGGVEIPASDGMKIYPLNAPKTDLKVLATLQNFRWTGDQNGPMLMNGICCDAVHTKLLSVMSEASKVTIDLTFECFAYDQASDFYSARQAEVKATLSLRKTSDGKLAPFVLLNNKPFDASNKYYVFTLQIEPAAQTENKVHVTLKAKHTNVRNWGHAA
jgi:hypothetical protein